MSSPFPTLAPTSLTPRYDSPIHLPPRPCNPPPPPPTLHPTSLKASPHSPPLHPTPPLHAPSPHTPPPPPQCQPYKNMHFTASRVFLRVSGSTLEAFWAMLAAMYSMYSMYDLCCCKTHHCFTYPDSPAKIWQHNLPSSGKWRSPMVCNAVQAQMERMSRDASDAAQVQQQLQQQVQDKERLLGEANDATKQLQVCFTLLAYV